MALLQGYGAGDLIMEKKTIAAIESLLLLSIMVAAPGHLSANVLPSDGPELSHLFSKGLIGGIGQMFGLFFMTLFIEAPLVVFLFRKSLSASSSALLGTAQK